MYDPANKLQADFIQANGVVLSCAHLEGNFYLVQSLYVQQFSFTTSIRLSQLRYRHCFTLAVCCEGRLHS